MGRSGEIKRPDLPPGRMRELNAALHELHREAGFPSARQMADAVGWGRSTVHNLFARPRLPQYDQFMAVTDHLALRALARRPIGGSQEQALDAISNRLHELWHRAKAEGSVQQTRQPPHSTQQIVLHLNPRNPQVLRDLDDVLHLHHTIRSLCPNLAGQVSPDTGRLLYRLDRDRGDAILRVQTTGPVCLHSLTADYARAVAVERVSWSETGFEGQRVQFLLDANATKATARKGQRSKRVGLQAAEMIAWWVRQASRAGLTTVEVRSRPLRPVIARREARNPTFLQATRLEGLALITDPIALQRAVLSGIGRGRAYGLGLLCLRPADTDVPPGWHAPRELHHKCTRSSGEQRGTTVKGAEPDEVTLRPFAQPNA
ncbi:type I-E CRISPR-associated protein Cas6/Cse3/CasE [Streptomyces griseofuscus]|uniref:type I-E CRISPR-associated protein Cas6/Cse3/CasE n=1 Tax=Streptomyces griseofuscus TaxID=146922 RepID=UPI00369C0B32